VSQTSYVFDSPSYGSGSIYPTFTTGKLLSKSEYGFGLGSVGPLLRQTTLQYLDDANPTYRTIGPYNGITTNIMDRVIDQQVQDGAGHVVAETKTTYDSIGLTNVLNIKNHDVTNFGPGNTIRGNPTQVQKLVSGSTFINTAAASYDTTGQITAVQDGNGNVTGFSYLDNFYNDSATVSNPPATFTPPNPTNAYPTQVTLPIIGAAKYRYYYGTGKQAFSIDQNGADTYFHYADPLDRPTHTFEPTTNAGRAWSLMTHSPGGTQTDTYSAVTDTSPSASCVSCTHRART
jgi:hypothetical protein